MDPLRIVARVAVAYVVLLVLVRLSGKRTVRQGSPSDFVVALVVGDLVDDAIWAEVGMPAFTVAAGVLTLAHAAIAVARARVGQVTAR